MIYLLIFFMGCCIGSFACVVLSRGDWYKGRSRCDECGCTLKWYDLIPLISVLLLRGKCRSCGKKISIIHPISEIYMGCAFLCAMYVYEKDGLMSAFLAGIGLFFLCIAAIEDMKEQMVHSGVLYCGIFTLLALNIVIFVMRGNWPDLLITAIALVVTKTAAFICNRKIPDLIGDGDFDLFALMILMLGAYNSIFALTISCIAGLIIYLPVIFFGKHNLKMTIPFAPLLYIGSMTALFTGGII